MLKEPDIFPLLLQLSQCSEALCFSLPAFGRSLWLIGLRRGGLFEWHTPLGFWEVVFPQVFIVTTNLPLLSGIIPPIQATRFRGFLKRDSDCPWLMSEMFNQQDCKDGPTSNFMWTVPQMTMCNKKKKKKDFLRVINPECRMISVCSPDRRQLYILKRSRSHL